MWLRQNPDILSTVAQNHFDPSERFYYNKINKRFAFAIVGFDGKESAVDPRYTKLIVRHQYKVNGEFGERLLDYHKCTDEDLAE